MEYREAVLGQKSDEEVVALSQSGQTGLDSYLIHRFYPLVLKSSRRLFLSGGEQEDLFQEGTVGLFYALQRFSPEKNVKFSTFASACILHYQLKAIEAANRKKHGPLNSYISFYETLEDGESTLMDTLASGRYDNPEELFLAKENYQEMQQKITDALSPMENKVLSLYLEGMDYKSISRELGKEEKSVDNAIQRIRNKVKQL